MGKQTLLLCALIVLFFAGFAHAQVLVNSQPTDYTIFDSEKSRTYFVDAGEGDTITFFHEGGSEAAREISVASISGQNVFSIMKAEEEIFDDEFLASENYVKDGK